MNNAKTHEVEVTTEQLNNIKGSTVYVTDLIEDIDNLPTTYILFKSEESSMMTKVQAVFMFDGLQEGYVVTKLNILN